MKRLVFGVVVLLVAMIPGPLMAERQGPKIALLNSSVNTQHFFDEHYVLCDGGNFLGAEEYKRYFLGWKYVLDGEVYLSMEPGGVDEEGDGDPAGPYDYQVIEDSDITNGSLDDYKVLILSNAASLSDKQHRAIQKWVQQPGNKLIATFGSGYKDIINTDPSQEDGLKLQSGGTGGIHQLWHDPWTKAFGTQSITPEDPQSPGIDVMITKLFGPTDVSGWAEGKILSYNAEGNLLVPRPEHFRDALAFLTFDFDMNGLKRPQPAILLTKISRGEVVYFAFAPEFIVSLAFDLAGHCENDSNYPLASPAHTPGPDAADFPNDFFVPAGTGADKPAPLIELMQRTIDYMQTGE